MIAAVGVPAIEEKAAGVEEPSLVAQVVKEVEADVQLKKQKQYAVVCGALWCMKR